ncbi:MAG: hypothetical protein OEV93_04480 [Candidatus Moranbacteria bacterium]|nr:hypothetical protein [Candidatus Moranbacteria bacterium]
MKKISNYISSWKSFLKNPILISLIALSIFINVAVFVLLYSIIGTSNPSIILHYNVYFGVDLIGGWQEVYMMPAIGLLFVFVNFLLAHYFYFKKERIVSHILMLTALMIQSGVAVAGISIAMINY